MPRNIDARIESKLLDWEEHNSQPLRIISSHEEIFSSGDTTLPYLMDVCKDLDPKECKIEIDDSELTVVHHKCVENKFYQIEMESWENSKRIFLEKEYAHQEDFANNIDLVKDALRVFKAIKKSSGRYRLSNKLTDKDREEIKFLIHREVDHLVHIIAAIAKVKAHFKLFCNKARLSDAFLLDALLEKRRDEITSNLKMIRNKDFYDDLVVEKVLPENPDGFVDEVIPAQIQTRPLNISDDEWEFIRP